MLNAFALILSFALRSCSFCYVSHTISMSAATRILLIIVPFIKNVIFKSSKVSCMMFFLLTYVVHLT